MTLRAKPKKDIIRKEISLMNREAEILNTSKKIKQYIRRIILTARLSLFQKYGVIKN